MIESSRLQLILERYHENKLPHAFLLETNDYEKCYQDVVSLLKQINCPFTYDTDCKEKCNLCTLFATHNLPSFITIQPDGQAIKKEQILSMMQKFETKPVFSKYNMYIVEHAEKLNSSSANTILKFLEEPEDNIVGFFLTNNKENVLSTVRSRCQTISVFYLEEENLCVEDEVLDNVRIYLNQVIGNKNTILYNKKTMSKLYKERNDWELFFYKMFYYLRECYRNPNFPRIDLLKEMENNKIYQITLLIQKVLKYIKSNVNIDLILDMFVIEVRDIYE